MTRMTRVALIAGLVVAAVLPAAATAGPTLGGRLSPVPLIIERADAVNVTNLSTMPVVAVLETSGGWRLAEDSVTLDVNERRTIPVTAIGTDDAPIRAVLTPVEALQGPDTTALALSTTIRHQRWYEAVTVPPWALLLLLIPGFGIMLGVRWRMNRHDHRPRAGQEFQGLAEYALLIALIAVVAIVALLFLGAQISGQMSIVGNEL